MFLHFAVKLCAQVGNFGESHVAESCSLSKILVVKVQNAAPKKDPKNHLVLRGWKSGAGLAVLFAMLARSFGLQRANFLLCPFKIAAHLMGVSHTLLEALTSFRKTSLSLLLKLHKLAVFGIHFTRCLSLHGHTAVKGDWVKRIGKAVLHVLLEVNAASRASAFIFAVPARILVPGRGSRVSTIAVGGDARRGANRVITFRRRDGILAVGGVLGALGGNGKRHGVARRSVVRRHDDDLTENMCLCQLNILTSDPSDCSRLGRLRTSEVQLRYESRVSRQQVKETVYKCWAIWDFKSGAG